MMTDKCLTDEEIAAYVDGMAGKALRERVEQHLLACRLCLHNVAELKHLVEAHASGSAEVPSDVLARAERVVAEHAQDVCRLGIDALITDGILKILRTTGDLLTPRRLSAVPVRGPRETGLCPRIAKSLSGYHVTVELVPCRDTVQPVLSVVEEATGGRPDGIKIKLSSPRTSETKYTQQGKVTFGPVGEGPVTIEVEGVGRIDLDIQAGSAGRDGAG